MTARRRNTADRGVEVVGGRQAARDDALDRQEQDWWTSPRLKLLWDGTAKGHFGGLLCWWRALQEGFIALLYTAPQSCRHADARIWQFACTMRAGKEEFMHDGLWTESCKR